MKKTFQLIAMVVLIVIIGGFGASLLFGAPSEGGGDPTGDPSTCDHSGGIREVYELLDVTDAQYLTMHTYSESCLDCSYAPVKPMRFPHSYFMGVCKCGFACDHPGLKDDGIHCNQCDSAINISFKVQGQTYIVPVGATWADAHSKYGIFFSDGSGRIMFNGTCLADQNGYLVYATYKVVSGAEYTYCQHTEEGNPGYTPITENPVWHTHFYNCATCGKFVSKAETCQFVGGVCKWCGRACSHAWDGAYCSLCGLPCTHNYVDGVCTNCHDGCDHQWSGGTCTVCQTVCMHPGDWTSGACDVCGYTLITFKLDGESWTVPQATTWISMTKYSQRFSIDGQDRVLFDGTVVLGPNAQPVGKYYIILAGENYMSCTHEASSVSYYPVDNGAHSASYLCSVCGHQDSALLEHVYDSNVCVDCNHECTHMVENGSCRFCGKVLDVFYVNDNYVFYAPTNAYWTWVTMSFEEPYNGDFESVDGKVYWRGYLLTDAYGNAVMTETEIQNEGFYYTCQHKSTYVSSFQYLNTKQHIQYHKCTQCDTTVNYTLVDHSWLDGFCMFCEYQCTHPLSDGIFDHCEVCGYEWRWFTVDGFRFPFVHGMTYGQLDGWLALFDAQDSGNMTFKDNALKYVDDTLVKATDMIDPGDVLFAEHHYDSDGICTDCGQECYHDIHNQNGYCTTCGKLVSHGYDNFEGHTCKVCGWVCPHDQFADGDCIYCGHEEDE